MNDVKRFKLVDRVLNKVGGTCLQMNIYVLASDYDRVAAEKDFIYTFDVKELNETIASQAEEIVRLKDASGITRKFDNRDVQLASQAQEISELKSILSGKTFYDIESELAAAKRIIKANLPVAAQNWSGWSDKDEQLDALHALDKEVGPKDLFEVMLEEIERPDEILKSATLPVIPSA